MSAGLITVGRDFFARDSVELAPLLLGAVLAHTTDAGSVAVRISEVEAYRGVGEDPALWAGSAPGIERAGRGAWRPIRL